MRSSLFSTATGHTGRATTEAGYFRAPLCLEKKRLFECLVEAGVYQPYYSERIPVDKLMNVLYLKRSNPTGFTHIDGPGGGGIGNKGKG